MAQPSSRTDPTIFALDAARAVAALLVLAAHARSMLIIDAGGERWSLSPATAVFFAATSLGHQAVIVFLVVSGAVITRSMRFRHSAGHWSAGAFATARLSRLWVALLPCLLVGGLEDRIGVAIAGGLPDMSYGLPGTTIGEVLSRLGLPAVLANLGFLQGLRAPPFGSNAPLWTLAIEAWCYAGAAACMAVWREPARSRAIVLVIGTMVVAWSLLPPSFWTLVPVWLAGAATALMPPISSRTRPSWMTCSVILLIGAALLIARRQAERHGMVADYILAFMMAGGVALLADWRPRQAMAVELLRRLAGFSYTLYLSHVPLLALLAAAVLHGARLPFGPRSTLIWLVACGLTLLHALVLWWLFERHTPRVRLAAAASARRLGAMLMPPQEAVP